MSLRKFSFEVLLVDLLLVALFILVPKFPIITSLLIAGFYDLMLFLWMISPNIIPTKITPRRLIAEPELVKKTTFLSIMCGNLIFLSLVVYLLMSGFSLAFVQEHTSPAASYFALLLHFFIGMNVVLLAVSYSAAKFYRLFTENGSWWRTFKVMTTDFAAGISILLIFLFVTQFLPVTLIYILTMGAGCLAALALAMYYTRKAERFRDAKSWLRSWSNAVFCAPFGIVVVLLIGYGPLGVHFSNADILMWHCQFSIFALVAILIAQLYRIAEAVWEAPRKRKIKVLAFSTGRLLIAIALAGGLLYLAFRITTPVSEIKAWHDLLLPLHPGSHL